MTVIVQKYGGSSVADVEKLGIVADKVVATADDDGLRDEPWRYRIAITVEGDTEGLGDARAEEIVGVERRVGDGREALFLLVLEHERRDLAGGLVDAGIGEVVAPRGGLSIEIQEAREATPWPETLADEADATLDVWLSRWRPGATGGDCEAARGGVLDEARVEDGGGFVLEHDGTHVVEHVDMGDPTVEATRALHATKERPLRLAEREFQVQHARVREHHHERAHTPRAAGEREPEVGPVDLGDLRRCVLEREEHLACGTRPKLPREVAYDSDAAAVPQGAKALEDARRAHFGRVGQHRADGVAIRIERA